MDDVWKCLVNAGKLLKNCRAKCFGAYIIKILQKHAMKIKYVNIHQ